MTLASLSITSILVVALLVTGAVTDLRWRRLPNVLTLGAAVIGIALALALGGLETAGMHMLGWLVGLIILMPIYLLGAMGAGDVKFLAAVGALAGPGQVLLTALAMGIVGGVFALALLISRRQLGFTLFSLWATKRLPRLGDANAVTMPYGVAIAIGGIFALLVGAGGIV